MQSVKDDLASLGRFDPGGRHQQVEVLQKYVLKQGLDILMQHFWSCDCRFLSEQRWSTMDPKLDQHPGSSLVSCVGSQGLQEPFSFPTVLPPKDLCFLPVDGMCSFLDMHGNESLSLTALLCSAIQTRSVLPAEQAQGLSICTTPLTSIIPGLPFTFARDFLRVFLEVKTICIYTQWLACLHVSPQENLWLHCRPVRVFIMTS